MLGWMATTLTQPNFILKVLPDVAVAVGSYSAKIDEQYFTVCTQSKPHPSPLQQPRDAAGGGRGGADDAPRRRSLQGAGT